LVSSSGLVFIATFGSKLRENQSFIFAFRGDYLKHDLSIPALMEKF